MFKFLLFTLLLINSGYCYSETRVFTNNRMTFREFAKLSAIVSQCEHKNIEREEEEINKFSKFQGLKLAKQNKLSPDKIAREVSLILFELDQSYPESIPESVCIASLDNFKSYQKQLKIN